MLSTLSKKHLPPHLSSLIGFPMLNSLWKPMLQTMLLLQSSPLLTKIMKFIQLPFTLTLSLRQSWTTTHMTRNCLPSSKLSRFGGTIWKVWPIPSTLLWIIRTLSIFLLPRYWPRGKRGGPSTFPSSILSSGSALVISAQNQMLSLDDGMSILKGGILAMPQSTLTTSSPSSLKNNLQPPYELWSFFFLLFVQLQSWIWTPYIKTSYWLSLVTQLLQNISPQMAGGSQTQMVYSFLTTEFIYHLLVTSAHVFSSTIMITSLLDILVKTKHWN